MVATAPTARRIRRSPATLGARMTMVSAAPNASGGLETCSASAGAPRNRPKHQQQSRPQSARSGRRRPCSGARGRMETWSSRRAMQLQLLRPDLARLGVLLSGGEDSCCKGQGAEAQLAVGRGAASACQARGMQHSPLLGQAVADPLVCTNRTNRRCPVPCCAVPWCRCCRLTDDLRTKLSTVEKLSKRKWTKTKYKTQDKKFLVGCRQQAWACTSQQACALRAGLCIARVPTPRTACCWLT
jgi:hypothetical protein